MTNSGNLSCKTSLRLFFSSKGFTSQVCMTFRSSSLSFIKFHPWINTICLILQEKKIKILKFSLLFPLNKSRTKKYLDFVARLYIQENTVFIIKFISIQCFFMRILSFLLRIFFKSIQKRQNQIQAFFYLTFKRNFIYSSNNDPYIN